MTTSCATALQIWRHSLRRVSHCSSHLTINISNTEGRRAELTSEISKILDLGKLGKSQANKLRGRMQFAENQIFGRLNRRALKAVSEHAAVGNDSVSFETRILLEDFLRSLNSGLPRIIELMLAHPSPG